MQHDEFIGQVQQRARLASRGEAERATRAVLTTLAQRLAGGAADHLAAQLPPEIGRHLRETRPEGRRLSPREFFATVAEREGVEPAAAAYHTRAVFDVLQDATGGVLEKLRDQLPPEFDAVFEAGTEGQMRVPDDEA